MVVDGSRIEACYAPNFEDLVLLPSSMAHDSSNMLRTATHLCFMSYWWRAKDQ